MNDGEDWADVREVVEGREDDESEGGKWEVISCMRHPNCDEMSSYSWWRLYKSARTSSLKLGNLFLPLKDLT